MEHLIFYIKHNWLLICLFLPGQILAVEAIIRQSAVDKGYPNVVSLCDRIANFVGFIADIIQKLIKSNTIQTTSTKEVEKKTGDKK